MNNNTPKILWSQTKKNINIKICVNDSQNVKLTLDDNINFDCESNNSNYKFSFKLLHKVQTEPIINVFGNNINILLTKDEDNWWSKITEDIHFKKHIKVDWDKWIDEDEDGEIEGSNPNPNLDMGNMQEMMKMMQMQNMGNEESCSDTVNSDECSKGCCGP